MDLVRVRTLGGLHWTANFEVLFGERQNNAYAYGLNPLDSIGFHWIPYIMHNTSCTPHSKRSNANSLTYFEFVGESEVLLFTA